MNNILEDVKDLKVLIMSSDEYKDYKNSLEELENHKEIKKMINKIVSLQKRIVKEEATTLKKSELNNELDNMYKELYDNNIYSNYINSSKKLNILISDVQNNFNKYFDSLVS